MLIEWMEQVCSDLFMKRQTFYLAQNYLDRYLSKVSNIAMQYLQLAGTAALFIASKMEEISPHKLETLVIENVYSREQILQMETSMMCELGYYMNPSTFDSILGTVFTSFDKFLSKTLKSNLTVQHFYEEDPVPQVDPEVIL